MYSTKILNTNFREKYENFDLDLFNKFSIMKAKRLQKAKKIF